MENKSEIENIVNSVYSTRLNTGQNNHYFIEWAIKYILSLTNRKFYGKLTLSFENGKVTTCKQEETIKPNL